MADADRGDRQPFQAFFQTDRYTYEWERDSDVVREPVRRQRVRALIAEPTDGASVTAGALVVRSVAWSTGTVSATAATRSKPLPSRCAGPLGRSSPCFVDGLGR